MTDEQFNWKELEDSVNPRYWEQFKLHLQTILEKIDPQTVANLATYYVRRYLPRFEEKYPQETWLALRLSQIEQAIAEHADFGVIFPERDRKFTDALARTYIWAVDYLWSMVRWRSKQSVFVEYATDSILNVITVLAYEAGDWQPSDYRDDTEHDHFGVKYRKELIQKVKSITD